MQLSDWLTTTLAVLTIALTILGAVIAIAAIWGYRGIKDESRSIAESVAKAQIANLLSSEQIQDKLKEEIRKRVAEEADRLFADISLATAFQQAPEGQEAGSVGSEYPPADDGPKAT